MTGRTFDDLDELCGRGRVFSEMFPGTAASDAWRAAFAAAHPEGARKVEPRAELNPVRLTPETRP